MATRGKPSVFAALSQLRVSEDFDSDNDSAEERQQERKEKQKQKKKSRNKKKNSDSAQLKDLAFVSVSKPKKSKGKKKAGTAAQTPPGSPVEEVQPLANGCGEEKEPEIAEPKLSLADRIKAAPAQPQKTAAATKTITVTKTTTVANGANKKPQQQQQQQQQKKVASPPKQQSQQKQPQHNQQQQQIVAPSPAPAEASTPPSSSEAELGAVYTPAHITITRVDGQMKRTVAVTEVMDQLLRYTQQNSQLLMVQEQLGHANRSLQDQLQRSAEIINGLQNEVTMFRQMCLNLQAEVSLLRSNEAAADAPSNPQPQHHHRPPPGMS
ncbi:Vesicle transport protein [Phytophthora cinnamomi]|uniref:Vesicle transport protein n=1 Tax=Phytophthora cinnamomi TaxID=4785 RepID=UPI00355940EC|nr:Vesicle transport protein [Phytophthora cinnamomi]